MTNTSRKKLSAVGILVLAMGPLLLCFQNCTRFDAAMGASTSSASSADSSSSGSGGSSPTATPSPQLANGAKLLWNEEFNEPSLGWQNNAGGAWCTTAGTWCTTSGNSDGGNGWGSEFNLNPVNAYNINPFTESAGTLKIRADVAPTAVANATGRSYISGGMRTAKLDFGNGYYEASLQMPAGSGMWPAFWLLPGDFSWPPEIDIVEFLGNSPTTDFTTVHSTVQFPNANNWGHWQLGAANDVGVDLTAGYHTYGVDFETDKITFYFDHQIRFTTTTPADLVNRKMYIVLNLAINGWGNSGNVVNSNTQFPADYKIDYVRYYSAVPF